MLFEPTEYREGYPKMTNDGTEFDFLLGQWNVRHRRLATRLAGADDWQEFGGSVTVHPILGGLGNMDDNVIHMPGGTYRAISLRAFDCVTSAWSIWWLDGRNPRHLDPPVVGTFGADGGEFVADDVFQGASVKVRFNWLGVRSDKPTWSQAFSPDRGSTWEVNWSMEFRRP